MTIDARTADAAILAEIGRRLARARLARNLTQGQLAAQAGVGRVTVARLEAGESVKLVSLIRILRVLDLVDALDRLIPPPVPSPIERISRASAERRRASGERRAHEPDEAPWVWGDEK